MTHELKKIILEYELASQSAISCVLATVVALDGSSYRRPGARMLLLENGKIVGAVSGGCVEKEVFRQAATVFKSGMPKVMTYDGRYRLGCEGVLYILLEPLNMPSTAITKFRDNLRQRKPFQIKSFYEKDFVENNDFGSHVVYEDGGVYVLRDGFQAKNGSAVFEQLLQPCFQLVIIGAEHDTVQLCSIAAMTGWEVTVVVHPKEEKTVEDFPGATVLLADEGKSMDLAMDSATAVVVMTHSYAKDLKYLIALKDETPGYFGLLGPARRREKLFNELAELYPDIAVEFLERIHGPAGLDIGAETPQEIALAILTEIIGVVNEKKVNSLKLKEGRIHV